ncbi:acyl carrier protein [Chenggangzhangella methanolivorans]|uniref:acyl carrier protein n=1 Tax=Chenggangzhangella methanolivorans TaxID=1437009 RepID=UPI003616F552
MADTLERLRRIAVDEQGVDAAAFTLEAEFESFGLDSLDMVELLISIEEEFGIEVPDAQFEGWRTVGAAVGGIDELTATTRGAAA